MIRPAVLILAGLALIQAALWVGPYFAFRDLDEYASITEQIWRHGTFALPDGTQSRFCWGFPVILQPAQAVGAGLEAVLGQGGLSRWVLCLVPLGAVFVGLALALRLARRLGAPAISDAGPARADILLALALGGLSAPMLQLGRRLQLEPVVGCCLLLGVLAQHGGAWMAVAGGCSLGLAVSCHYAYLPGAGILALGVALLRWRRGDRRGALLLAGAFLAVAALTPASNALRYGSPFQDGYSRGEPVGWQIGQVLPNLPSLGLVLLAVPWWGAVLGWWRRPGWDAPTLIRLACAVQVAVWLGTWQFREFPLRYLSAWVLLGLPLLPGALARLRAWGPRPLAYSTVACLLAAVLAMASWPHMRPLETDAQHPVFPGQVLSEVWYVPKAPYVHDTPYTWIHEGTVYLTAAAPPPPWAWLLGGGLVALGIGGIVAGVRRGSSVPAGSGPGTAERVHA